MHKSVTFDFDGTLQNKEVQQYAKELVDRGIDVHILSCRYDDLHAHMWPDNPVNNDLWEVVKYLGIPEKNVHLINMAGKHDFLKFTNVLWHLENDLIQAAAINVSTNTLAVLYQNKRDWKETCNKILNIKEEIPC